MSDPDDVTAASNEAPPLSHLGPAMTSSHDGDTSHRIRPPPPGDVTTMTEPSGSDVTTPGYDMEPPYDVPRRSDSAGSGDVDVTTPGDDMEPPYDVPTLRDNAGSGDVDDTALKEVVEASIAGALAPEHSTQGS